MLPSFFKAPLTPLALTFSTIIAFHLSVLVAATRFDCNDEGCFLPALGLVGGLRSCSLVIRRLDDFQPQ
jgi:hypothetical protein